MKRQAMLIPVQRFRRAGGRYRVADGVTLASPRAADALPLEQLREALKQAGVKRVRIRQDAGSDAAVRIHRDPAVDHAEGYRITIGKAGLNIAASTDAGAFYAVQTLRDLLATHGRDLPTGRIDDWPDFPRRAVYHDTARGKVPTVETIKGIIERLARWKINELQLYVENNFTFAGLPDIGRGFDGYRPDDLHAIEQHCRRHHVRFVGSLTSFGHMELILKEPAYRKLGELPGYNGYPGGTTLCPIDPGSAKLMRRMYDQFVPLFEATDFNACGDEPWELGKGRSEARAKQVGVGRLYLDFMLKVHDACQSHGKRTNVWADIVLKHPDLLGDWPSDIVMLNWGYKPDSPTIGKSKLIADAGLAWLACSGTNGWASHGSRWPMARDNVRRFTETAREHGAAGVMHTDWGDGGHRNTLGVSMLSFAHAAAHAWNGRAVDDQQFPRTFARVHFQQTDDDLGDRIEQLGRITEIVGSDAGLYYAQRVAIATPRRKKLWRVDHGGRSENERFFDHDPTRLAEGLEVAEALSKAKAWPSAPRGAEPFERLTLAEYRLAALQDFVNGRRAQLGTAHQRGERVTPRQWRQLDGQLQRLGETFDELWLARNRRSRLPENQLILNHARREAQRLAES